MTAPTPDDVARLVDDAPLADQAEGRARFLRDRGEVKTPDLIEALAAKVAALQTQVEAVTAKYARAKKIVAKVYNRVTLIADDLCDEGDRVYLGSTNSADLLRDLRKEWDEARIMGAEPLTAVEEANAYRRRAETAETALTASRARVAELERNMAYIVKQWPDSSAAKTARAALTFKEPT